MFAITAAIMGRRMAFCGFKSGVGAKVLEAEAPLLLASGAATQFRSYGKPAMKEMDRTSGRPSAM